MVEKESRFTRLTRHRRHAYCFPPSDEFHFLSGCTNKAFHSTNGVLICATSLFSRLLQKEEITASILFSGHIIISKDFPFLYGRFYKESIYILNSITLHLTRFREKRKDGVMCVCVGGVSYISSYQTSVSTKIKLFKINGISIVVLNVFLLKQTWSPGPQWHFWPQGIQLSSQQLSSVKTFTCPSLFPGIKSPSSKPPASFSSARSPLALFVFFKFELNSKQRRPQTCDLSESKQMMSRTYYPIAAGPAERYLGRCSSLIEGLRRNFIRRWNE